MKNHTQQREVLQQALEAFQKSTGLSAVISPDFETGNIINIHHKNVKYVFRANVKLNLTKAALTMTALDAANAQSAVSKQILVARYITPQMSAHIKSLNMPFLDTAGNAYLNEGDLFVYIKGGKLKQHSAQPPLKRPFKTAGLRVIFALLCNPGLEKASFRNISMAANVALGSVSAVVHDLKQIGHLIEIKNQGRQLIQKKELLDKWIMVYPEQLRSKLLISRYEPIEPTSNNWWQNVEANPNFYWSGEIAAKHFLPELEPSLLTVYIKQPLNEFLHRYQLRNAPEGKIEILDTFWGFDDKQPSSNRVPPLLIYADLIASGNPKNLETAKHIYEKELLTLVQEDYP
jgi:hypothetical protein